MRPSLSHIVCVVLLLTFAPILSAQGYWHLSGGANIATGDISTVGTIEFGDQQFPAVIFFDASPSFSLGAGFPIISRLSFGLALDVVLIRLTKRGQIVADAATDYTRSIEMSAADVGFPVILNFLKSKSAIIYPFLGVSPKITNYNIAASGFETESTWKIGADLIVGFDLPVARSDSRIIGLRVEGKYGTSHTGFPRSYRIHAGIVWRRR